MPLPIVREFHLYVSTIEDEINAGVAVENRTAYKPKRVAKKRAGSDNKSRGKKDAKVQQRELSTFDKDLRGGSGVGSKGNGEQEKPDEGRPDIGSSKPRGGTRVRQGDKRVQPEQRVSRLEPEEEKHRNRSEAMKGNQNAKKDGALEEELQTPHILTSEQFGKSVGKNLEVNSVRTIFKREIKEIDEIIYPKEAQRKARHHLNNRHF